MRNVLRLGLILAILLSVIPLSPVSAQDPSPWSEVFDENGNLRSDVVDLGVTTETPSWMNVDLPLGQSLQLDANYHRFQTADGNMVVLPSASTLFFMAMNPQESGLANSAGMMSNGSGSMITFWDWWPATAWIGTGCSRSAHSTRIPASSGTQC